MKRAVVVFSGGQDSTTCLVQALQQYDEVHCVTFDYGQRHRAEIDVARELALKLGARAHKVLDVTLLNELAVSSLTRDSIPVPDYEPEADGIRATGSRLTYCFTLIKPAIPLAVAYRDRLCRQRRGLKLPGQREPGVSPGKAP